MNYSKSFSFVSLSQDLLDMFDYVALLGPEEAGHMFL